MNPRVRAWKWQGLIPELAKIPLGLCIAAADITQSVLSAAEGVHGDLVAHYNHLIMQDHFREEVMLDLEQIPEV